MGQLAALAEQERKKREAEGAAKGIETVTSTPKTYKIVGDKKPTPAKSEVEIMMEKRLAKAKADAKKAQEK